MNLLHYFFLSNASYVIETDEIFPLSPNSPRIKALELLCNLFVKFITSSIKVILSLICGKFKCSYNILVI